MLVTYSLGVAQYLVAHRKDFLRQCYILGAGSGCIAAVAACAEDATSTPEAIKNFIVENVFNIDDEKKRQALLSRGCELMLPDDVHQRMKGRCTLAVGMSNRDVNYFKQPLNQQLFGAPISAFDGKSDVQECLIAATAPNATLPFKFRGEFCTRCTWKCMSSELDQYVRHIYIHGISGYPYSSQHTRHNMFFGRHGLVANTHWNWQRQFLVAIWPCKFGLGVANTEVLREAYDRGFQDAMRYERWDEDPYTNAKADRSPGDSTDWKTIRAAFFGSKQPHEDARL